MNRFSSDQRAAALRDLEEFGWVMIDSKEDATEVANAAARRGTLSEVQSRRSPRGRTFFVVSMVEYHVKDQSAERVS